MPYKKNVRRRAAKKSLRKSSRNLGKTLKGSGSWYTANSQNMGGRGRSKFGINLGQALHVDRPLASRGAFPPVLYTKLRYTDKLIMYSDNLTNRTGSTYPYRLGSLYDPYFNAGGHQPLGFDQLSPIYFKYHVYKVDVQIRMIGKTGSAQSFCVVCLKPGTSTYTVGGIKSAQELQEQPGNTIIDGSWAQTWNQTYDLADVQGISRKELWNEAFYSGTASTDPVQTPYLEMACGTYDEPSTASNSVTVMISLVYHARFSHPNPLNGS